MNYFDDFYNFLPFFEDKYSAQLGPMNIKLHVNQAEENIKYTI